MNQKHWYISETCFRLTDVDTRVRFLVWGGGAFCREVGAFSGCKGDYEGPGMRGLLLKPEKVCRKSGTHSGNKLNSGAHDE